MDPKASVLPTTPRRPTMLNRPTDCCCHAQRQDRVHRIASDVYQTESAGLRNSDVMDTLSAAMAPMNATAVS